MFMTMTVLERIQDKLSKFKPGKPIPYRQLKGFGSNSSTQRALRHLCQQGDLVRVMVGFYVRPKVLDSVPSVTITCSPEDLALAWAREQNHILTTTSFEESYRLGFQTQMPVKKLFWTNGPNRVFVVGNSTVSVGHVSSFKLLWYDQPVGSLYRALLDLPYEHTKEDEILSALRRLYDSENEARSALNQLIGVRQLRNWHPKFQSVLDL